MTVRLLQGHVTEVLRSLPAESVHCVVTSPPYYGLRAYGTEPQVWDELEELCEHKWVPSRAAPTKLAMEGNTDIAKVPKLAREGKAPNGFTCPYCNAWKGELGLEPTMGLFLQHIVQVFREVRRVLRKDGTLWLNIGDSYNRSGGAGGDYGPGGLREGQPRYPGRSEPSLKAKDLMGIPWRTALALQADGWWLRADIIWFKKNGMPEPARGRPVMSHEYLFLLTRSERCFYDADAIREKNGEEADAEEYERALGKAWANNPDRLGMGNLKTLKARTHPLGRNRRSVWEINTEACPEAHFATFPQALVRPCIQAGTSEVGTCASCGASWARVTKPSPEYAKVLGKSYTRHEDDLGEGMSSHPKGFKAVSADRVTIGWRPTCKCGCDQTVPATVLDPFSGSGTTALVAYKLGRDAIGIDLKEEYHAIARKRLAEANEENACRETNRPRQRNIFELISEEQ